MAITENRALRDKRNALVDELIKLSEQYSTLREDVLSGDQQRAAAALGPLESLETQLAALSLQVRNVQVANSTGNDFDPKLARSLEELINNVIDVQNGTAVAKSLANKAVRIGATQNTTQSAGEEVKQSGDAGVTNPSQPTQTFTSPDAAATTTQTEPVVATANKDDPSIGQTASPSPDATPATVQTNAEEAVDQNQALPPVTVTADREDSERATKQSYVFYATRVTSEFRQGRFEQTLEGALYIFPRPKKSQVVDTPAVVTSAELGSQSFGLTDNRVNPGKKKVASPQDARKATISSQTFPVKKLGTPLTNTQATGEDNTPDTRFFGF